MNDEIEKPIGLFLLLLSMAFVSVALSIFVFVSVPSAADFYNLVYEQSRPAKPESKLIFFAVFPFFQLGLLGVFAFRLLDGQQVLIKQGVLWLLGSTIFFLMSMYRCMSAWSYFH